VVFRLDPDLSLHRMIEGVSIPNGISWMEDNKMMYFADSPTKSVFKYDYDLETGSISNRRVFFHVEDEDGVPDGHVPDEEGHYLAGHPWSWQSHPHFAARRSHRRGQASHALCDLSRICGRGSLCDERRRRGS
jgi:sugar lactone lactonase YvrE